MTKEQAHDALIFLVRCPLKGDEVPAFVGVQAALAAVANPELAPVADVDLVVEPGEEAEEEDE